jgi:hypothetical protein
MKIRYGQIPNETFCNYLGFLIDKVYKILPMKEQNNITLHEYLESLQRELIGNIDLIIKLKEDRNFLSLMSKIQYLIDNEYDNTICKKEVFSCINIIEKIIKKYRGDNVDSL